MKFFILALGVTVSTGFANASEINSVSLTEKLESMQLTETMTVVEGKLWARATQTCLSKGAAYAIQSSGGFTYEVLVSPVDQSLKLGGFAKFECK